MVRKRLFCDAIFILKIRSFAKTGSGQAQEKLKRRDVSCRLQGFEGLFFTMEVVTQNVVTLADFLVILVVVITAYLLRGIYIFKTAETSAIRVS
eukprot:COSAG06_NODE_1307_length_9916_cov_99.462361_22_plen_94_part_00